MTASTLECAADPCCGAGGGGARPRLQRKLCDIRPCITKNTHHHHRILSKYLPCRQVRISRLIRQNFDTGRRASLTFRQFRGTSTACSRQITQTCSLYHPATNHRVGYHLKYNHCNCNTLFIPQEKSYILFRCTLVIPRQHKDCAMTELKQRTFGTRSLLTMLCSRLQHPHVV